MQGDPSVIDSLNAVAQCEITVFEVSHAFEHVFQARKYKGLTKWFDKQVKKSRDRRRYLTDRTFELGGSFVIQLMGWVVDPKQPPEAILQTAQDLFTTLLAAYQAAYVTAESSGDSTTAAELCDLQESVESALLDLEAFAGEIADVGLGLFLKG